LLKALKPYRSGDSKWVFPSPVTGGPYTYDTILAKHIKPVAKKLKLPHMGWHTLRHSYASWIGRGKAPLRSQMNAMRHSAENMTLKYGGTPVEVLRPFVEKVARQLRHKKAS
jgi:integrase